MSAQTQTKLQVSVRPLGARIAVRPIDLQQDQVGGLYIPETAQQDQPQQGEVIAVGPGKLTSTGERLPMEVSCGDRVLFTEYAPREFELGGEEVLLIDQEALLAVLEE